MQEKYIRSLVTNSVVANEKVSQLSYKILKHSEPESDSGVEYSQAEILDIVDNLAEAFEYLNNVAKGFNEDSIGHHNYLSLMASIDMVGTATGKDDEWKNTRRCMICRYRVTCPDIIGA